MVDNSSFDDIKPYFPFLSGWMSLLMFDQGAKIKSAAETDMTLKVLVMALLTLSYVKDVMIAIFVFLSYFIFRFSLWNFVGNK